MSFEPTPAVRHARPEDAAAIARIYNQGIEARIATFQTVPRSLADVQQLVLAATKQSLSKAAARSWPGASAGTYHSPLWYQPIAEHSVHVDRAHRRTGAGQLTLQAFV
jgi:phosphinothricin acetyltransferase